MTQQTQTEGERAALSLMETIKRKNTKLLPSPRVPAEEVDDRDMPWWIK